jgi:C-terminal novel E3 ligase, LRR-interacting/Leucine rich repeat
MSDSIRIEVSPSSPALPLRGDWKRCAVSCTAGLVLGGGATWLLRRMNVASRQWEAGLGGTIGLLTSVVSMHLLKSDSKLPEKVGIPGVPLPVPRFEDELQGWRDDPSVSGAKQVAYDRILAARDQAVTKLDLYDLKLTSLPSVVFRFTHLTELELGRNKLKSLAPEIKNLVHLNSLSIFENDLETLPPEIGELRDLTSLMLNWNKLLKLPAEIGRLSQLRLLCLGHNQLTSLPAEISLLTQLTYLDLADNGLGMVPNELWRLVNLEMLDLSRTGLRELPSLIETLSELKRLYVGGNSLKELPEEVGLLSKLETLGLEGNEDLERLPYSIRNLTQLKALLIKETAISWEEAEQIVPGCTENIFKPRLESLSVWVKSAGEVYDFSNLKNGLTKSQAYYLERWLNKLEETFYFRRDEQELSKKVCAMLSTVATDSDFKTLFFRVIQFNLVDCENRAGAAFNEIYPAWRVLTAGSNLPFEEGWALFVSVAKSLELRKQLQMEISAHPEEKGDESTEIYLYYEVALQERLGLEAGMRLYRHEENLVGKRAWMDVNALIARVEANFFDSLPDVAGFTEFFASHYPAYAAENNELLKARDEKGNALYKKREQFTDEAVRIGYAEIRHEYYALHKELVQGLRGLL